MKKREKENPNRTKKGMLTTFRAAQKVHMEANLRFVNSIDTKLMYYTVVHKCFEYNKY